ncbi:interferon gamma receptor 1 [Callorhinchus milii]|nr:interferon gamma receptor 1 [Callorhinchus milii]|eukprot:gi/632951236/ref/XP_007891177.1/ PREDICTED: interferon gamma receptor 1-like [Callorhinchus milii]
MIEISFLWSRVYRMYLNGFLSLSLCLSLVQVSWASTEVAVLLQDKNNSSQHELSPPINLSINSYNLKTILIWDYDIPETYFRVECKDYRTSRWKPFPPCSKISTHYCDVTKPFTENLTASSMYYAKVKAVKHLQESAFAFTPMFSYKHNGTIGPPTTRVMVYTPLQATVKCEYPLVANLTTKNGFKVKPKFTCNICIWPETSHKKPQRICKITKSNWTMNISQSTWCVSAQVNSVSWEMKGMWSKPQCFKHSTQEYLILFLVLIAPIVTLLVIANVFLLGKFLRKEQVLPKSLLLIVKGMHPYIDMKTEKDSISVVIKHEKVIPNECDIFYEEAEKSSANPESNEQHVPGHKYAEKDWMYDRPQLISDAY